MRKHRRSLLAGLLAFLLTTGSFGQPVWAMESSGQEPFSAADADAAAPKELADADVEYTYEIIPLLPPFNEYFYVKTEDPDPSDLRFVDKSSVYYEEGRELPYLEPEEIRFTDVLYEDKDSGRVKGGYIFGANGFSLDGGTLAVEKRYEGKRNYEDTGAVVECPAVEDYVQYLIDTYTSPADGFFEKLDSIQQALNDISLYPMWLKDVNRKSEKFPYPMLTVSPYAELSLNDWYEMYENSEEYLLTECLYPYVLSSLSFPSTMVYAALRMEPTSSYEWGDEHYLVEITKDGETQVYGGAGNGSTHPLYSNRVEKCFLFDDSEGDYVRNASLSLLKEQYQEYQAYALQDLEEQQDLIVGKTFSRTIGMSSWIRVGSEGFDLSYKSYAFVTHGSDYDPENPGFPYSVEDIWVDGRYVNRWNQFVRGAKFDEYPTAPIMVRAVDYTDRWERSCCGDLTYYYDEETDSWICNDYPLMEPMVLTRQEVEAMQVDKNTDIIPSGLLYDGSAYPGTPYEPRQFEDVSDEEWFAPAVRYVLEHHLMTGLNSDMFGPYDTLARAQFAVILHRMSGEPAMEYTPKFADVQPGLWYTDAVLWANSVGVVNGYTDTGLFGTADSINREQMATMMYRYAKQENQNPDEKADISSYTDAARVSGYAKEAMSWAVGSGIITGKDNGTRLDPQGTASRAECATIIMRFWQKYHEEQ